MAKKNINKFIFDDGFSVELIKKQDIFEIINMVKEAYDGEYPFIDLIDEKNLKKKIKSERDLIYAFKLNKVILATIAFELDFETKIGYLRTFVVKKEFRGNNYANILQRFYYAIEKEYENKITRYYAEIRTQHSVIQHFTVKFKYVFCCFLKSKDFFSNKHENELLILKLKDDVLSKRIKKNPIIIRDIENVYNYISTYIPLGKCETHDYFFNLNQDILKSLNRNIKIKEKVQNYHTFLTFYFENNKNSYLTVKYDILIHNIQIIKFKTYLKEELFFLLLELLSFAMNNPISYIESYISAYNLDEQLIFKTIGFGAYGYVPCWYYNIKEDSYQDRILFLYIIKFNQDIVKMQLVEEARIFLSNLNID